ncbi:bifunctional tetrahydrofolate synthase/dihydrofolate synthase [Neisseriaceae bacterium B1]
MKRTLNDWLSHLETAHSNGLIDMGLARINEVKQRMNLQPTCPVIMVGGTNGKGSTCAFLSRIYSEAGYQVGTLTSPHLIRFNERITINTQPVNDETIIESFERIEAARGNVSLTYFEFNTLAAVDIFQAAKVDVMILEVGLGGRLDAVNIFDADCAIVTSVDLDHQAYLGDTVEQVAFEKASIFRAGKPAICAQIPAPHSLTQHAAEIGTELLLFKQDFHFDKLENQQWSFRFHPILGSLKDKQRNRNALPMPALRGAYQLNNAACALAAIECLNSHLPVDIGAIKRGLLLAQNIGRFQVLPGRPLTVLDVGHNPHAARALRQSLIALPFAEKRTAVFSMLSDKDIDSVLNILHDQFDEWLIAPLDMPRGRSLENMQDVFATHHIHTVQSFDNIQAACEFALSHANENDRIVVFGSFHTVAEAMAVCH